MQILDAEGWVLSFVRRLGEMMQESFLFDSYSMNMYFLKTLLMTACLHIHGRLNAVSLIMCEKSFSVNSESMLSIKGNDG